MRAELSRGKFVMWVMGYGLLVIYAGSGMPIGGIVAGDEFL